MKICSWNVNSIRARIDNIKYYLSHNSPDIVFFQEIKTEEKNFPFNDLKKLGYVSYVSGQKSYNGVSILSKTKLTQINKTLPGDKVKQARLISANIKFKKKNIELINIYVPNGNPVDTEKYKYKKKWLNQIIIEINKKLKKNKHLIIGGDFNIIPEERDVYDHQKFVNDALFKLEIRKKYRTLINLGLNDAYRYLNKDKQEFTFWEYMGGSWPKNHGMRIDLFLVSNDLLNHVSKIYIDKKMRSRIKPSDHVPVEIELN